jgi:hypothetical protein
MEQIVERTGVWIVVAILAMFVIAYSLWGASVLRAERQGNVFSTTPSAPLSAAFLQE